MSQPDPNTIATPVVVKATLKALPDGAPITVHFNPASLVYTVENSNPQQGGDPKRRQFAAQFTGKLTMDLQFDTTSTGTDVRKATGPIAKFMQPEAAANKQSGSNNGGANKPAPPVVSFDWGAYSFKGVMESFKETIDFFSADGIPLRALLSIALARQDGVLDSGSENTSKVSGSLVQTAGGNNPGGGPGGGGPGGGQGPNGVSTTTLATQGGDPNAARALASANNLENPRFTAGASLEVSAGIQLNPAVGFVASASVAGGAGASAGASLGVSGGLGLSLSASAGTSARVGLSSGASTGFGLSASTGASAGNGISGTAGAGASTGATVTSGASLGIGVTVSSSAGGQVTLAPGGGALYGSKASAGVPATMGAFAGLEVGRATVSTTAQLDPTRMLPATVGSDISAGAGASFGLGGVAMSPTGFSTDVGANFSFNDRLAFDGD
jgi:Contractile injection system tube protein